MCDDQFGERDDAEQRGAVGEGSVTAVIQQQPKPEPRGTMKPAPGDHADRAALRRASRSTSSGRIDGSRMYTDRAVLRRLGEPDELVPSPMSARGSSRRCARCSGRARSSSQDRARVLVHAAAWSAPRTALQAVPGDVLRHLPAHPRRAVGATAVVCGGAVARLASRREFPRRRDHCRPDDLRDHAALCATACRLAISLRAPSRATRGNIDVAISVA